MVRNPDFRTARDMLLDRVQPVATEQIALDDAFGRILGEDLAARDNIPPFDRSPLDGYALIAADTAGAAKDAPVTLRILEEVAAGAVPTKTVVPGTATKILTGAPIPPGANAVTKYEETEFTAETVTVFRPFKDGENIIYIGEDVRKGEVLATAGTAIDAGVAGTLAAQGMAHPVVYRRARVGLISTGNEVVEADAPMAPGKIRNSNRHTLGAAIRAAGLEPVYLGLAGDDAQEIAALICQGLATCDAVVLTGGASVGDYDLTAEAFDLIGAETLFTGVDLKPGMACVYGIKDGALLCGLSGNPASSLTNLYCVALPALKKMAGYGDPVPAPIRVTLKSGFRKKSKGTRILRGTLDLSGGAVCMTLPRDQGNVVLSSTIGCNVMAIVPAGSGPIEPNTTLEGFML